jgi:hypothetical protein
MPHFVQTTRGHPELAHPFFDVGQCVLFRHHRAEAKGEDPLGDLAQELRQKISERQENLRAMQRR